MSLGTCYTFQIEHTFFHGTGTGFMLRSMVPDIRSIVLDTSVAGQAPTPTQVGPEPRTAGAAPAKPGKPGVGGERDYLSVWCLRQFQLM